MSSSSNHEPSSVTNSLNGAKYAVPGCGSGRGIRTPIARKTAAYLANRSRARELATYELLIYVQESVNLRNTTGLATLGFMLAREQQASLDVAQNEHVDVPVRAGIVSRERAEHERGLDPGDIPEGVPQHFGRLAVVAHENTQRLPAGMILPPRISEAATSPFCSS